MLYFLLAAVIAVLPRHAAAGTPEETADYIAGTLIVFNNNGAAFPCHACSCAGPPIG
jgi:hypothetical protein